MRKIIALFTVLSTVFVSCESRTYEDIQPYVANPTYEANVKQVISSQCLGCHGTSQTPYLNTYDEVKFASQYGLLLCRIDGSCGPIMPQSGKMAQVTIDMIKRWAAQGYVEQ